AHPGDACSARGRPADYHRVALGWLAFLRRFAFGGCLADDMGLGKTVMVLAWLDRLRAKRELDGPSLVVVPRSLLFNWLEEAARFAPQLRLPALSPPPPPLAPLPRHHILL